MNSQHTLSIIKPDAVQNNCIGRIYSMIEASGLKIVAAKMLTLSKEQAEQFYIVHKDRPFYNDLVTFMVSGRVMVQVLEGVNALNQYRSLMGATNPQEAARDTIRACYGESIERNAVHGSDSEENAKVEIDFFFPHFFAKAR